MRFRDVGSNLAMHKFNLDSFFLPNSIRFNLIQSWEHFFQFRGNREIDHFLVLSPRHKLSNVRGVVHLNPRQGVCSTISWWHECVLSLWAMPSASFMLGLCRCWWFTWPTQKSFFISSTRQWTFPLVESLANNFFDTKPKDRPTQWWLYKGFHLVPFVASSLEHSSPMN